MIAGLERAAVVRSWADGATPQPLARLGRPPALGSAAHVWSLGAPPAMRGTALTGSGGRPCASAGGDAGFACNAPGVVVSAGGDVGVWGASMNLSLGRRFAAQVVVTDAATGASAAAELVFDVLDYEPTVSDPATAAGVTFSGVAGEALSSLRAAPGDVVTLSEAVSASLSRASVAAAAGAVLLPHLTLWPPLPPGAGSIRSDCPAAAAAPGVGGAALISPGSCGLTLTWAPGFGDAGRETQLCFYALAVVFNASRGLMASPGGVVAALPVAPLGLLGAGAPTAVAVRCLTVHVTPASVEVVNSGLPRAAGMLEVASSASPVLSSVAWAQGERLGPAEAPSDAGVSRARLPAVVVTGAAAPSNATPAAIAVSFSPDAVFLVSNASSPGPPLVDNSRPSFWAAQPGNVGLGFSVEMTVAVGVAEVVEWFALVVTPSHGPLRVPRPADLAVTVAAVEGAGVLNASHSYPTLRALREAASFEGAIALLQPAQGGVLVTLVLCNASVARFQPRCTLKASALLYPVNLGDGIDHTVGLCFDAAAGVFEARIDGAVAASATQSWPPTKTAFLGVVASVAPTCRGGRCTQAAASNAVAATYFFGILSATAPASRQVGIRDVGVGAAPGRVLSFSATGSVDAITFSRFSFNVQACSASSSFVDWVGTAAEVVSSPAGDPAALFRFHCRSSSGAAISLRTSRPRLAAVVDALIAESPGWHIAVLGLPSPLAPDAEDEGILEGAVYCAGCEWLGGNATLVRLRFGAASFVTVWRPPEAPCGTSSPLGVFAFPLTSTSASSPAAVSSLSPLARSGEQSFPRLEITAGGALVVALVPQSAQSYPASLYCSIGASLEGSRSGRIASTLWEWVPQSRALFFLLGTGAGDDGVGFASPAVGWEWNLTGATQGGGLIVAARMDGVLMASAEVMVSAASPSAVHSFQSWCNGSQLLLTAGPADTVVPCAALSPVVTAPHFDGGCLVNNGSCVGLGAVVAGSNATLVVALRDAFGNAINATLGVISDAALTVSAACRGCIGVPPVLLSTIPVLSAAAPTIGLLSATLLLRSTGVFDFSCVFDGRPIQLAPSSIVVLAATPSAALSRVVVDDCDALTHVFATVVGEVRIWIGDAFGNAAAPTLGHFDGGSVAGWGKLLVSMAPRTACARESALTLTLISLGDPSPGWLSLRYSTPCAGWHTINASIVGEAVEVVMLAQSCASPVELVPPRGSSSDHVFVAPLPLDPNSTVLLASAIAAAPLTAGTPSCVANVVARDAIGNARPLLPLASSDAFFVDVALLDVAGSPLPPFNDGLAGSWPPASDGISSPRPTSVWAVNVTLVPNGSVAAVCITPLVAGEYALGLVVETPAARAISGSPLPLTVVPGRLHPQSCIVSGAIAGGISAYALPIEVIARDAFGNVRAGFEDEFFLHIGAAGGEVDPAVLGVDAFTRLDRRALGSYNGSYTFNRTGTASAAHLSVLVNTADSSSPRMFEHVLGSPFVVWRSQSAKPATAVMSLASGAVAVPSFSADESANVSVQLFSGNGSAFTHSTPLLAASITGPDGALVAGSNVELVYLGNGAYSLEYGCDAALSASICITGGAAELVVVLDGELVFAGVSAPGDGLGRPLAALVTPAPAQAGSSCLFVPHPIASEGSKVIVNATLALASGARAEASNATLVVVSPRGVELFTTSESDSLYSFVPQISGTHLACLAVSAQLFPSTSMTRRFACAGSDDGFFVTLLPSTNASFIAGLAVVGEMEIVAGAAFVMHLLVVDSAGVFDSAPFIRVTLWQLCLPTAAWVCSTLPSIDQLCKAANASSVPSSAPALPQSFEYSVIFNIDTVTVAGCLWTSASIAGVMQDPLNFSVGAVQPGAPALVSVSSAAPSRVPLPALLSGGVHLFATDVLVVALVVSDMYGNVVPFHRLLHGSTVSATLRDESCLVRSATPGIDLNVTAFAFCEANATGILEFVARLTADGVVAAASLLVTVAPGPEGIAPTNVSDAAANYTTDYAALSLMSSTAFGDLFVTRIDLLGAQGATSVLSTGGIVTLSFAAFGPRFEPLLFSQLSPNATLSVTSSAQLWPCIFAAVQHAPCDAHTWDCRNYSSVAVCSFATSGMHDLRIRYAGLVGAQLSAALEMNVTGVVLDAPSSLIDVVICDPVRMIICVAVDGRDAVGNLISCRGDSASLLVCLLPETPWASQLCVDMISSSFGTDPMRFVATLGWSSLSSGFFRVSLVQQWPLLSDAFVVELINLAVALPPPPTVALTTSATSSAPCASGCLVAARVFDSINVLVPATVAAFVFASNSLSYAVLGAFSPTCDSVWCTFAVPISSLNGSTALTLTFRDASNATLDPFICSHNCSFSVPSRFALSFSRSTLEIVVPQGLSTTLGIAAATLPPLTVTPILRGTDGGIIFGSSVFFGGGYSSDGAASMPGKAGNESVLGIVLYAQDSLANNKNYDSWWSVYVPGDAVLAAWQTALGLAVTSSPMAYFLFDAVGTGG